MDGSCPLLAIDCENGYCCMFGTTCARRDGSAVCRGILGTQPAMPQPGFMPSMSSQPPPGMRTMTMTTMTSSTPTTASSSSLPISTPTILTTSSIASTSSTGPPATSSTLPTTTSASSQTTPLIPSSSSSSLPASTSSQTHSRSSITSSATPSDPSATQVVAGGTAQGASGGLSGGAIGGIVVGVLAVLAIIAALLVLYLQARRKLARRKRESVALPAWQGETIRSDGSDDSAAQAWPREKRATKGGPPPTAAAAADEQKLDLPAYPAVGSESAPAEVHGQAVMGERYEMGAGAAPQTAWPGPLGTPANRAELG